jgi:hypothetical protein
MYVYTTFTRPLSVQAQYSRSCPIISSSSKSVTLRLAVYRQSVCLGIKPLETHYQNFFSHCDWRSVSLSVLVSSPSGAHDQILVTVWQQNFPALLTYIYSARTRTYRKHITWSLSCQSTGALAEPTEHTYHVITNRATSLRMRKLHRHKENSAVLLAVCVLLTLSGIGFTCHNLILRPVTMSSLIPKHCTSC